IGVTAVARLFYIIKIDDTNIVYTILNPIIWSAIEISLAIVAACMSSVMPLCHALFSRFSRKNKREFGPSHESYSKTTKLSFFKFARFKKSSSMVDTEDGVPPSGLILLSNTSGTTTDVGDDAGLVDDTKSSEGICNTNQKAQLSEPLADDAISVSRDPDGRNPASGFPWGRSVA
ncbi:hypothetical protein MMC29_007076, partial [Sticta canariensis]|nr:hypothetical protein [Sticta canariensis]